MQFGSSSIVAFVFWKSLENFPITSSLTELQFDSISACTNVALQLAPNLQFFATPIECYNSFAILSRYSIQVVFDFMSSL